LTTACTFFDQFGQLTECPRYWQIENYGRIVARGINFDVIFDGKPITDEMFASNTAILRAKALRDINTNVLNLGCSRQRNVAGYWFHEPNSNLCYTVYSTTRRIKAGEWVAANYNEGVSGADCFFNTYASLIAGGSAPAELVRCGCKTSGLLCMNIFASAFDRSSIERQQQLPPAAALAIAVAQFAVDGAGGGAPARPRSSSSAASHRPPPLVCQARCYYEIKTRLADGLLLSY
jgi:hypothetical protein